MKTSSKWLHLAIYSVAFAFISLYVAVLVTVNTSDYAEALQSDVPEFLGNALRTLGIPAVIVFFLIGLIGKAIGNKAEKAGRSWVAFFWLSALVSPIIMGIIAVTLKPLDSHDATTSSNPPKSNGDLESKLVELQSLKDKGILSEAEFNEAKKKALDL